MLRGVSLSGEDHTIEFSRLTLVAAVKPHCDGCHDFIFGDLSEFRAVDVVIVSALASDDGEWDDATQPILVAPDAMKELRILAAPHYVLVDPRIARVVAEGVIFSPVQVAHEIASFLVL
ncbi:MAG TPA: hypothetical protein VII67_01610 [Acidimicrobiales bacterium]